MKRVLILITTIFLTLVGIEANATEIRTISYTEMPVPAINSSFKTYMDYRAVTNRASAQYELINSWGWPDSQGFMRINGEHDLGIDNYYMVALGSYYGTTIGTKYRFTTNTGNVFYGILADAKDDRHTNHTHQYALGNNDVVEFLVYTPALNKHVKLIGSANVYMPLNGSISKIERIDFYE